MDINRITDLTLKYIRKEILPEEQAELDEWLDRSPYNRERFEARIKEENILTAISIFQEAESIKPVAITQMVWQKELQQPNKHHITKTRLWWRTLAIAAVFIGLVAIGLNRWIIRQSRPSSVQPAAVNPAALAKDFLPAGNRATLTLVNGAVIELDSAKNGLIAVQGNDQVVKGQNGNLVYQKTGTSMLVGYNTITTPRGGKYEITLPDGTKVLLNAESSLRFPTAFNGATREVSMTGEGFFEVAKDRTKPFLVSVSGATIVALGTEFNVMAYADEQAIRATLVNGLVKVIKGNSNTLLQPGQQAEIAGNIKVNKANIDEVTAWKNGLFEFNSADIQTVMRSLARWYNVKVRYEGEIPRVLSSGSISRNNTALVVLKVLQEGGFHFTIDGDTIIIKP
jgi:transmembrane sensor